MARIINYDILTSASDKTNIDSSLVTPHNYLLVEGDVRNSKLLQRVLCRYDVDTVVHFAAETHVQNSFETPLDFVKVNVEGTVTLLNECLSYGKLKRFVYISTDEVYGDSSKGSERAGQRPNKTCWRPPTLTRLRRPLRSSSSTCSTNHTIFQLLQFECATCTVHGRAETS